MKTKFRIAFFAHFYINENYTLMMFVFLDCCQYLIYAKIRVQHGVFRLDIEILNNTAEVIIKRISSICVWAKNLSILS